MFAARYYDVKNVIVEEVPKPQCGPYEVLVNVVYAGICGSDLHIYQKGMFVSYSPIIMGHEFVGIVVETGKNVTDINVGEHVTADPRVTCGQCWWCENKLLNYCPNLSFIGEASPGCFAEYISIDAEKLFVIPSNVELRNAALAEPLAVVLHLLKKVSRIGKIGIVGAGPIGLLSIIVAKQLYNIGDVIAIDVSQKRLEKAKEVGADLCFKDFNEAKEKNVDLIVEAAGREVAFNNALQWLNPDGVLVMVGLYEEQIKFDPNEIVGKEIKMIGANAYDKNDLKESIDVLASKDIDVSPVITHVLPLQQAPKAFSMLSSKNKSAAKIILEI